MFDHLTALLGVTLPFEIFVALAGLGVGLVLYLAMSQVEERSAARSTLRHLDDYQVEDQREQELLAPARERMVAPLFAGLSKFGGRLNPPHYVESVRLKACASRHFER